MLLCNQCNKLYMYWIEEYTSSISEIHKWENSLEECKSNKLVHGGYDRHTYCPVCNKETIQVLHPHVIHFTKKEIEFFNSKNHDGIIDVETLSNEEYKQLQDIFKKGRILLKER